MKTHMSNKTLRRFMAVCAVAFLGVAHAHAQTIVRPFKHVEINYQKRVILVAIPGGVRLYSPYCDQCWALTRSEIQQKYGQMTVKACHPSKRKYFVYGSPLITSIQTSK